MTAPLKKNIQSSRFRGSSPWTRFEQVKILLWGLAWFSLCRWTPKHLNMWRIFILRLFGANIGDNVFVHQSARIYIPWNVDLRSSSCVGDRANLYSLDMIIIGRGSVVAQESYLCCGTHDFEDENHALLTSEIYIGDNVFIGARAFVLPGVQIANGAVVGACSVVTRDVMEGVRVAGNPARRISFR